MLKKEITTYIFIIICLVILAILNVKDEQKLRYFKEKYEQSEDDRTSLIKENKMLFDEYMELLEVNKLKDTK
ncbi:MAG: hypothetical protein RSD14_04955 [Clostridia bacterium]